MKTLNVAGTNAVPTSEAGAFTRIAASTYCQETGPAQDTGQQPANDQPGLVPF